MSQHSFSVPLYFVRSLLKHLEEGSDAWLQALDAARMSTNLLTSSDERARVSLEQLARLEGAVTRAMNDELLGYGAKPLPAGAWDLVCQACISAENLNEVIARFSKFYNLLELDVEESFHIIGESAEFRIASRSGELLDVYFYERSIHCALRFFCWILGSAFPVKCIYFPFSEPEHSQLYRVLFPATEVRFDQDFAGFCFHKNLLSSPVTQDALSLRKFLRRPSYELMMAASDDQSWSTRIQKLIGRNIVRAPSFEVLAEQLNVHSQTLRRRLADEGTTYRNIKNNLRRDTSIYYLGKPGLSIENVAERTGFAETSSFIRAFKGWTGLTPHSYRKEKSAKKP